MSTLVIGMGNPILCDDALGVRLARDFRALAGDSPSACSGGRGTGETPTVEFIVDCSVGGLNLLDLMAGHDRLIVFDSIKTQGASPGGWYHMTASSLRETMNLSNVHDVNFATALELGRRMGMRVPADEQVHIFAVEIADNLTFSETMSPVLEAAYPELAEEILGEALHLLTHG